MPDLILHEHDDTATSEQKKVLERAENAFGMVPNLLRLMAGSPATANAYLDIHERLGQGSLTPVEQQVVLLSASFENECHYCMAAHTAGAKQAGMDEAVLEALRGGTEIPDERLAALSALTREIVVERGWPSEEAVRAFRDAGFDDAQILDVMAGVTLKTLSNYTNHIAETPLDEPLQPFAWSADEAKEPAAV